MCSADLEEYRTINYGTGEAPKRPQKKKKYIEPGLKDDYKTNKASEKTIDNEEDFDPLEELSAMSTGAVTGPGSRKKKDEEDDILIREYISGIKIKTKIRTKAN